MNRKLARENLFLLLFEGVARPDAKADEIFELAVAERDLQTDDYVKTVFFGVYEKANELDKIIEPALVGWKANRLSVAARAILRLSAYELCFMEDIPPLVSINEAVELAKRYDDEKSYSFINGVLNTVAIAAGRKDAN
jgi:N utilization substance protein B